MPSAFVFEQALPLLRPVVLVDAVVVVARFGDADLEEVGIAEHRVGRRRSRRPSGRRCRRGRCRSTDSAAPAASCRRPDRAACCRPCCRSRPRGTSSSATACPCRRSRRRRSRARRAPARRRAPREKRAAADAAGLRTRIDVVDDRILLRRIEVGRLVHQAVRDRSTPSRAFTVIGIGGFQPVASSLRDVGLLERQRAACRRRRAARRPAATSGFE